MKRINVILFLIGMQFSLGVMAAPISYKCTYSKYADENGKHNYTEAFKIEFLWDKSKNTAYILGNLGTDGVKVVEGEKIVTFIETTPIGNVMTTSIANNGRSVHSRHSIGVPSQSYGTCAIK